MICVGLSFSISPSFVSFSLFQQEAQEYWVKPNPCFKYWYRSYQASMPFLHDWLLKQKGKVFVCSTAIITAERAWVFVCVCVCVCVCWMHLCDILNLASVLTLGLTCTFLFLSVLNTYTISSTYNNLTDSPRTDLFLRDKLLNAICIKFLT